MILVGLGANLPTARFGSPRAGCEAAVAALEAAGLRVIAHSRWYRSKPVPPSDQPDYVNGMVAIETALPPEALLAKLHEIERAFGRERRISNAARTLDLDLIAFHNCVSEGGAGGPILPHPRMTERAFVLLPLQELAPDWRHPHSGMSIADLVRALPPGQHAEPLE